MKIRQSVLDSQELLIKKLAAEASKLNETAKLIFMSQGVPCMPIFQQAQQAMIQLIQEQKLPYCDVAGLPQVKQVCAQFVNHFYHMQDFQHALPVEASQVVITAGAIQALCNVLTLSVENKDDIVVTTLPAYGLYKHQTELLGGTFCAIPTDASTGFVLTKEQIHHTFQQHGQSIRVVVLCYPNNPTGAMLSAQQAQEIAEALDQELERHQNGFSVVLDEVYLGICNKQPYHSVLQYASPRLRANLFLVLSASKGLGAMPGARAAFLLCPQDIVPHMIKIQSAASANASTIAQYGMMGSFSAILNDPSLMEYVSKYYQVRTSYIVDRLNQLGQKYGLGQVARTCDATFYVWISLSGLPRKLIQTDTDLVVFLRDMYQHALPSASSVTESSASASSSNYEKDESVLLMAEDEWLPLRQSLIASLKGQSAGVGLTVVPGSAFLMNENDLYIRFSCARSDLRELRLAMDVLDFALSKLSA